MDNILHDPNNSSRLGLQCHAGFVYLQSRCMFVPCKLYRRGEGFADERLRFNKMRCSTDFRASAWGFKVRVVGPNGVRV